MSRTGARVIRIGLHRLHWREWSNFAPTWERIHDACPGASFFLSRVWVDCWLKTFGDQLNPILFVFTRADEAVGCCLVVQRTKWVRGIPLTRLYLNCDGENDGDSTCIEYNRLLSVPDCAELVAAEFAAALQVTRWDELLLSGMDDQCRIDPSIESLGRVNT